MNGYAIFVLFLVGALTLGKERLRAIGALMTGALLGEMVFFPEKGFSILMYRGMIYLAIVMVILWLAKTVFEGVYNEKLFEEVEEKNVFIDTIMLGTYIGMYASFMVMLGGVAGSQFSPFSIVTIFGDLSLLTGGLILLVVGLLIGTAMTALEPIIIRNVCARKVHKENE